MPFGRIGTWRGNFSCCGLDSSLQGLCGVSFLRLRVSRWRLATFGFERRPIVSLLLDIGYPTESNWIVVE